MAQEVSYFQGARVAPRFWGSVGTPTWSRIELSSLGFAGERPPSPPTSVRTERYPQPQGEAGVMNSLRAVAKMATEGMTDWRVRSWSISRLRKGGNPQTSEGRGRVLLAAMRDEKIWVPDATETELVQAAHLTLGDGVNAPVFEGGDCDCLTTAMLGAFLATCATVDAKAAVVGHSYREDRQLEHVLGAILGDDGRWYYVEPSSQTMPFGVSKKPTREVVILVPSQKKVCDDTACFRDGKVVESMFRTGTEFVALHTGPAALSALGHGAHGHGHAHGPSLDQLQRWYAAGRDGDPTKGPKWHANRAEVAHKLQAAGLLPRRGAGGGGGAAAAPSRPAASNAAALERLAPRPIQSQPGQRLGADPVIPQVAIDTDEGWMSYLSASVDDLVVIQRRYHDLYDGVLNVTKLLGLPKFDADFTAEKEADLIDLDAMIAFMIQCLRDAIVRKRRLVLDGAQWGIEALAGDKVKLQTIQEEDGSFTVVMVIPPPLTNMDGLRSSVAYGPIAIAGLVAAALAAMGVHFLILKTLAQSAESALQAVLQYRLQSKYIDCINNGLCTPEQVVALQKAFMDAGVAMTNARTAQIKAENKPIEDVASAGKWILGFAALVVGILVGYEFKDSIRSSMSGGSSPRSSGGRSSGSRTIVHTAPRSSGPRSTVRSPAGSRTAGGTKVSYL